MDFSIGFVAMGNGFADRRGGMARWRSTWWVSRLARLAMVGFSVVVVSEIDSFFVCVYICFFFFFSVVTLYCGCGCGWWWVWWSELWVCSIWWSKLWTSDFGFELVGLVVVWWWHGGGDCGGRLKERNRG